MTITMNNRVGMENMWDMLYVFPGVEAKWAWDGKSYTVGGECTYCAKQWLYNPTTDQHEEIIIVEFVGRYGIYGFYPNEIFLLVSLLTPINVEIIDVPDFFDGVSA